MRTCPLVVLLSVLLLLASPPGPVVGGGDDARLVARVRLDGDGFVRVRAEALRELGIPDPRTVVVERGGRPVNVCPADGEGDLVFLAHDTATETSRFAVYELWAHGGTVPRPTVAESPVAAAAGVRGRPLTAKRALAADRFHGPLAAGRPEVYDAPGTPTWFLASIQPAKGTAIRLGPLHAAPDAPQTLDVMVYATRIGGVAVRATWGGKELGVAEGPSAHGGAVFRWQVPADAVPSDEAPLALFDVSPAPPPPPPNDVSDGRGTLWIDHVVLDGAVERRVGSEVRAFDLSPEGLALEAPTAEAEVLLARVGPDGAPLGCPSNVERPADAPTTWILGKAAVPRGTRLFAATAARDVEPDQVERVDGGARPDPVAAAAGAEHVILAVGPLVDAARRLAAHRTKTGTRSAVVPVKDVYEATFGHGEPSVGAIRRFVLALLATERPPRFLVLAGDATLDRTDLASVVTIPTPFARTMYNGATSADRLYALPPDGSSVGGVSIGRLPFRTPEDLEHYVERVIRYETTPPEDASRRMMRFVTNEARFGAFVDKMLEGMFRGVVANDIPLAYDIEVTFASLKSPFLWPPREFNEKVIRGFNEGCLFYTYVGHGFAQGFDALHAGWERYNVLHVQDVGKVRCRGTPPACFVIACTTAIFDSPRGVGVGEALLANPEGPVAYWGATRICHPAANTLLGRSLARTMARGEGGLRLGEIIDTARDDVLAERDPSLGILKLAVKALAGGADATRLSIEGSRMYTLLGDPALRMAFPASDLAVRGRAVDGGRVEARVEAPLPDGTKLHVSVEVARNQSVTDPEPVPKPLDPAAAEIIRANHRRMNDFRVTHVEATLRGGAARVLLDLPPGRDPDGLILKAWCVAAGDVHQGAARVEKAEAPAPAAPAGAGAER